PRRSLPAEPPLERGLRLGPVVVDHGVPRRVAPLAAAHELVLAGDAFEPRAQLLERRPRALVRRVRLELDAEVALVLERVPQEEVLGFGVRVRSRARPSPRASRRRSRRTTPSRAARRRARAGACGRRLRASRPASRAPAASARSTRPS